MSRHDRHRNRTNRRNLLAATKALRAEGLIDKTQNPSFAQIDAIKAAAAKKKFEEATRGAKGSKPTKVSAATGSASSTATKGLVRGDHTVILAPTNVPVKQRPKAGMKPPKVPKKGKR